MDAPSNITNARSDRELILIWMADKSRTTQASFKPEFDEAVPHRQSKSLIVFEQ